MNEITKGTLSSYVVTGEFDIEFSVKQDKDSDETKSGTLRFKMDKVPLSDIVASSLKDKRINAQVGLRGDKFATLKNGQIVVLDYKGGRVAVDPEVAMLARLQAMTADERAKWFAEKQAELAKLAGK